MIEDTLNKFQKKRIEERLKLDFNLELLKSKKIKERIKFSIDFRNQIDIMVDVLFKKGVMFYGIEISMPFLDKDDTNLWYYTHLQLEGWVNTFRDEIELIEFCYFSIEIKEGLPLFKGLIGVRSLIGINDDHFSEIRKILVNSQTDILIKKLSFESSIKNYWNYVIRQNNFHFHRFVQYSEYYDNLYGEIADLELQHDPSTRMAFGLDQFSENKYSDLSGIKDLYPCDQTIINYLTSVYMNYNNIFLSNGLVYKKVDNSLCSWESIDSIDFFRKNNIIIIEKLKQLYPQQLSNLNIPKLFTKGWYIFFSEIKKNNHYLPTLKIEKDAIEFIDGVYLFNDNIFQENHKKLKINCIKYYDLSYFWCLNNIPERWLNFLEKDFGKKDINDFCISLGRYFNQKKIINKKNNLVHIIGGCTKKVMKFNFFVLKEKVSTENNFYFIENRKTIINIDYCAFDKKKFFLKKNNDLNKSNIKFSFNDRLDTEMNNIFINKLLVYTFTFNKQKKVPSEILSQELAQIMVYCNNLYFKSKIKEISS